MEALSSLFSFFSRQYLPTDEPEIAEPAKTAETVAAFFTQANESSDSESSETDIENNKPALKGRVCTYWTMAPGIIALTLFIILIFFAVVTQHFWWTLPLGIGAAASAMTIYMAYRNKNLESFGKNNKIFEEHLGDLNEYIGDLEGQVADLEGQLTNFEVLMKEQQETFEGQSGELRGHISGLEKVKGELEEQHATLSKSLAGVQQELESSKKSHEETARSYERAQKQFEETRSQLEGMNANLDEKLRALQLENERVKGHADSLEKTVEQMNAIKGRYDLELKSYLEQIEYFKKTISDIHHSTEFDHKTFVQNLEKMEAAAGRLKDAGEKVDAAKELIEEEMRKVEEAFEKPKQEFAETARMVGQILDTTKEWMSKEGVERILDKFQEKSRELDAQREQQKHLHEESARLLEKVATLQGVVSGLSSQEKAIGEQVQELSGVKGALSSEVDSLREQLLFLKRDLAESSKDREETRKSARALRNASQVFIQALTPPPSPIKGALPSPMPLMLTPYQPPSIVTDGNGVGGDTLN